jgi:hemerythrin
MATIAWKPYYSVGDASIDAEHKQVLSFFDNLHYALDTGRERDELKRLLNCLLRYTMTHFKHEEQMMLACGYPDFENHKSLHDQMQKRTAALCANVNLITARDLLGILKAWWCDHIQAEDKCYVPYLNVATGPQLAGTT